MNGQTHETPVEAEIESRLLSKNFTHPRMINVEARHGCLTAVALLGLPSHDLEPLEIDTAIAPQAQKRHQRITIIMGGCAWAFRHFPMQAALILMWKLSDMSDTGVGVHEIRQTDLFDLGALPSRLAVKHFPSDQTTKNMGDQTTENMGICLKVSFGA